MIKHFLGSIILAFLSISTVTGQSNALDLSGKWNFQIDREDTGVKEQWFRKILEKNSNFEILSISEPYANKGTNKYFRVYVDVERIRH